MFLKYHEQNGGNAKNNTLTKWAFQKIFNNGVFRGVLFKNYLFFTSLVEKPLKWKDKKQKHTIVWNTKFYNPAKFELKQIKTVKVVSRVQFQA